MRSVTVRVTPGRGWFGSFHRATVEADDLTLDALYEARLLNDGSSVVLYEYTGSRETAERLAAAEIGDDGEWRVAAVGGRELMYAQTRPSRMASALLSVLDEWTVVVDWPVLFPSDETLLLTLIGTQSEIRAVLDSVPSGVTVSVRRTGQYQPELERVVADLTPRERETVFAAVELGYYRNPREARYDDIAEAVDCSAGTVGHHLRNAEAKLLGQLLSPRTTDCEGAATTDE